MQPAPGRPSYCTYYVVVQHDYVAYWPLFCVICLFKLCFSPGMCSTVQICVHAVNKVFAEICFREACLWKVFSKHESDLNLCQCRCITMSGSASSWYKTMVNPVCKAHPYKYEQALGKEIASKIESRAHVFFFCYSFSWKTVTVEIKSLVEQIVYSLRLSCTVKNLR